MKPKTPIKKFELRFHFNLRNILLVLLILFFVVPFFISLAGLRGAVEEVSLSSALSDIKENKVEQVKIEEERIVITYKDGNIRFAHKERGESFVEILKSSGIDPSSISYNVAGQNFSRMWVDIAGIILPLALMALFFFFIFRQARGAQDTLFSFGQSRAKLFAKGKQSVTFGDVAGVDEAKRELEEVVDFLKNPAKYSAIGARTPKGVLLVGPPGTGKTLLARALAGEADVPFFSISGSEFMEMLVGVGAARVRDLFSQAKKTAPSIIFIDEVESIGRARSMFGMTSHDEREQTLNQILVEMDGFSPKDNVVVIAASNRPDLLDPALLRPGRFDRRVMLDMPDKEGRLAILKIHARGKKFAKGGVNWEIAASRTVGFSGADLENMLNEAAIFAARGNKKEIYMSDIEEAATKVKLGPVKKRLQTEEDKKITAYHEAGHAIVTHLLPNTDPVHRISIVARGMSLGHTFIPPTDRAHETRSRLLEQITAMLGGRAAEDIVFGEMTTGAANDIENATRLTRHMVIDFGMSGLGPIAFGSQVELGDGRPWLEPTQISPSMQQKIDYEVKKIIDACYKQAKETLVRARKKLDQIAKALLEKETLERDDFEKIVGTKPKVAPAFAKIL